MSRLEAQPVELLQEIWSYLPSSSIAKSRRLNKFFKAFIKANLAVLLRQSIADNKARIHESARELTSGLKGLTLSEAIEHFYDYYGTRGYNTFEFRKFIHSWQKGNNFDSPGIGFKLSHYVNQEIIKRVDDRVRFNTGRMSPLRLQADKYRRFYLAAGLQDRYEALILDDLYRLPSIIAPNHGTVAPKHFLTARYELPHERVDGVDGPINQHLPDTYVALLKREEELPGDCEDIAAWLGLPDLSNDQLFSYCVHSTSIWWIAAQAQMGGDDGLPLLKQAAVLEGIFIW